MRQNQENGKKFLPLFPLDLLIEIEAQTNRFYQEEAMIFNVEPSERTTSGIKRKDVLHEIGLLDLILCWLKM